MSTPDEPAGPSPSRLAPRVDRKTSFRGSLQRLWNGRRKRASLSDLSPGSGALDGIGPRARRRRKGRHLTIGVFVFLAVAFLAVLGDAYWQSYRAYKEARGIVPTLTTARQYLAQGQLPPGDPVGTASRKAALARRDVDHARLTFKLAGLIPLFNRPVLAIRHGVDAAVEDSSAATGLEDLVRQALGDAALPGHTSSPSSAGAPIYQHGAANVRLIRTLTPQLERIISSLRAADRDLRKIPSIPFVHALDRLKAEAIDQSDKAIKLATDALAGARLLPGFLGADKPRTYFMAMQNNADLRGTGGSTLAYAFVSVKDGKPSLVKGGSIYDLHLPSGGKAVPVPLSPPVAWYIDHVPNQVPWFDSVNFSPDFPLIAPVWAQMVKAVTGRHVDGVILVDPFAVADMLGTGAKIHIPSYPAPITGANLVQVVEHDQYRLPASAQLQFPAELIAAAWPLIANPNPFVPTVRKMGPSLSHKHLQLWSADPAEESLLSALGWDGSLRLGKGDYLFAVDNHRGASKVDWFTRTKMVYDATVLRSGAVQSSLQVTLTNSTPADEPTYITGIPSVYAQNVSMISVFAPRPATVLGSDPLKGLPDHVESGAKVFIRTIAASPGTPGVLTLDYTVPGAVLTTPTGKLYSLTIQHQPLVEPPDLTVRVTLPKGAVVRSAPGWTVQGNVATLHTALDKDLALEIAF